MSLKAQNINRSLINDAILTYCDDYIVTILPANKFEKYHIKKGNEVVSKLNVFFIKGGKTTISWSECSNPLLSQEIAEHIVNYCKYSDKLNTNIFIKHISSEDIKNLLDYVVTFGNAQIEEKKNIANGIQYKLTSIFGDVVYLNHFTNNAFNVQGQSGLMKSIVLEGLSSYLPYSEIVEATLKSFEIEEINLNEIDKLFMARFPNAYSELTDTTKCIIMPTFIMDRINLDFEVKMDYSFMVFPILRGLEACIKELFLKYNINCQDRIGQVFKQDLQLGYHIMDNKYKNQINNNVVTKVFEMMYNFHKNNRHAIFHVDDTIITTRLIDDLKVAISLINETAEIIEKCYTAISQNNINLLR